MGLSLKICGMKCPDNIQEVAELSPDYMGFIFYSGSKRFVGDDFVIPEIPSSIEKVGVFVNESEANILNKQKQYKLDYIQLHGDENADFCKSLSRSAKIIKAFGVDESFDFSILNNYTGFCDYFLFDTKTSGYGGSGKSFDKGILKNYKLTKPFFVSGGIRLEEISHLIPIAIGTQISNLFAIDVNSQFEIEPGLKDINKLKLLKNELSGK